MYNRRARANTIFTWLIAGIMMMALSACDSPEEKAKSHYESGMAFVADGNFVKAGIEFRNALQLKENYADGWYGLALVEENEGNWQKYAGDVLKAIELDPKHVKAQTRFGKIMLLSGRLEDALKASDLVMTLAPDASDSLALKAAVLFKLGDKAGAVKEAKAALKIDSSNIDAVAVLAAERLEADDPAEAVVLLNEGLVHSKDSVPLQIMKMQALDKQKKNDEIVVVFRELIAADPENIDFRKRLAQHHLRNGQTTEAETVMREIAAESPDDVNAQIDVVRFVKATKGDEAAEAELEALVKAHPEKYEYQFALAELEQLSGNGEKAQTILQSIAKDAKSTEDALSARNRLAQMQLDNGNTDEAKILVDEVLAGDPQNATALVLNAAMEIDKGNIDTAISNLRSSLKQRPESVRASLLLARAHEIGGAKELAEDRLATAYRYSKQEPAVGLTYVQFFLRHSEQRRAQGLLEKMIEKSPNNVDVLKAMAQLQLLKQNWGEAEELAVKIRALDEADSTAYQISGLAMAGQQNSEASESAFEKAYETTPEAGQAMVSLVQAYIRNGNADKAETFLKSVLDSSPDNSQAKLLLAQIQLGKGQEKQAETIMKEVIASDPEQQAGYMMLMRYYSNSGKADEAQAILTEGLAALPDSFVLNLTQAGMFESQGKFDEAIATYEKLIESRPNSDVVVNNLASLIAEGAEDEEALRRAYALAKRFRNSKVPYFKDTLGWIHYRLGEYDLATPLLLGAVDQLPNMAILRYHLGMAYKAQNNMDAAKVGLEAALKLAETQSFAQKTEAQKALDEIQTDSPK